MNGYNSEEGMGEWEREDKGNEKEVEGGKAEKKRELCVFVCACVSKERGLSLLAPLALRP